MEISFIKVKDNQLDQLVAVGRTSFSDAYTGQTQDEDMEIYLNKAFHIEKIKEELINDKSIFFFVKNQDTILGYIKLRWDRTTDELNGEKSIELERFYLLKEHYKKGIGLEMLQFCERYALKHHFLSIWLLVWQENLRALHFYQKKGFVQFGIKLFEFAGEYEENWLMKKALIAS